MASKNKHVLITGGTGLIGKELTNRLLTDGHTVSHLSRKPGKDPRVKTFLWDVTKGKIDDQCIDSVNLIIHLAGAGIADKRWTTEQKKLVIESRTRSIQLIYDLLKRREHTIEKVISASGVGYYSDRGDAIMTEGCPPAYDFLGECCIAWEQAVDEALALGLDTLKFRTGVVLSPKGGALPQLAMPVKLGFGAALGSGKQWVPWIHHADAVDMYLYGLEHGLTGVYNMAAPEPLTNAQLTQAIAKKLKRPLWLPKVPAFFLRLLLGERATLVLGSTRAIVKKIQDAGFRFKYPGIDSALNELYG